MRTRGPTFGAFNQGGISTIACFNKATVALGVNFDALIAAMQVFVDKHVAPVWGTPAKLIKSKGFVKGAWAMVFPIMPISRAPSRIMISRPTGCRRIWVSPALVFIR